MNRQMSPIQNIYYGLRYCSFELTGWEDLVPLRSKRLLPEFERLRSSSRIAS
jgi:hypothetical protein